MAKFIIEVSDDYIREHADTDKLAERTIKENGENIARIVVELIAFSNLEKKVDAGENEFTIVHSELSNSEYANLLDTVLAQVASLAVIALKD